MSIATDYAEFARLVEGLDTENTIWGMAAQKKNVLHRLDVLAKAGIPHSTWATELSSAKQLLISHAVQHKPSMAYTFVAKLTPTPSTIAERTSRACLSLKCASSAAHEATLSGARKHYASVSETAKPVHEVLSRVSDKLSDLRVIHQEKVLILQGAMKSPSLTGVERTEKLASLMEQTEAAYKKLYVAEAKEVEIRSRARPILAAEEAAQSKLQNAHRALKLQSKEVVTATRECLAPKPRLAPPRLKLPAHSLLQSLLLWAPTS